MKGIQNLDEIFIANEVVDDKKFKKEPIIFKVIFEKMSNYVE